MSPAGSAGSPVAAQPDICRYARRACATSEYVDDDIPQPHATDEELRIDVAAAIESLPPHYREVVVLRDFEEMTVNEIGVALVLTREAVKGRLHCARALLREYLSS